MKQLNFTLNGSGLETLPELLAKSIEADCSAFSSPTMTIMMFEKYGGFSRDLYMFVMILDFTNPQSCRAQLTIGGRDEDFLETKWSFRNQEFRQFLKLMQALCQANGWEITDLEMPKKTDHKEMLIKALTFWKNTKGHDTHDDE